MSQKHFRCLSTATPSERFTLRPLSRRDKLLFLGIELVTLTVFVVVGLGIKFAVGLIYG